MTMNERFAVEPSSFESANDIRYLFEKFGFEHGRFIAKYPSKWLKTLWGEIYKLPELEQAKAKRIIERHSGHALLSCDAQWDSTLDWCDNALAQAASGKFNKIVIGTRPPDTLFLKEVDEEILGDSRGERVAQTAEEFVRIAGPLLDTSPEIFLVDPYFRMGRPSRAKVLVALIKRAE